MSKETTEKPAAPAKPNKKATDKRTLTFQITDDDAKVLEAVRRREEADTGYDLSINAVAKKVFREAMASLKRGG
jgi:hypothetical protein